MINQSCFNMRTAQEQLEAMIQCLVNYIANIPKTDHDLKECETLKGTC